MEETFLSKERMGNRGHEVEIQDKKTSRDSLFHPFTVWLKNSDICCPSEQETIISASDYEQNSHGKFIACDVSITRQSKFRAVLADQQLENGPGWLGISILELLVITAVHRSQGLCSLHPYNCTMPD